ncbi:MAG: S8 family serine peptidase [Planctomycetota bacterium]|jgi:subtilisin family serine protease
MTRKGFLILTTIIAICLASGSLAVDLEIIPLEDFDSNGLPGGPFSPPSKDYQLTNVGPNSLYWGADITADWLDLWPWWGLLDPCESTIVTVSLTPEANSLPEGIYGDTLSIFDITNEQEHTRDVNLTIALPGGIWVDPNSFDVNVTEGTTWTETLTIGNDGDFDLNFAIQTRVAGSQAQSQKATSAKAAVPSAPKDHDFTVPVNARYKPDELLVRFAPRPNGIPPGLQEKTQILNALGGLVMKRNYKIVPGLAAVKLPPGMTVEDALQRFDKANGILYAQPNYRLNASWTFPNDSRFAELWGMHNTGQTGGTADADIDAPEAWDITTGSNEIIVAVLDTGVDYTHSDLASNMWVNKDELNGDPGVDDDNNGYVDDIYGYDFVHNDGDPMDDHYHGTHVAGTIGAVGNNSEGVTGVCWNVKIMALKFLDETGGGWTDDAIACLEYAVLMGANVTNNSYGGSGYDAAFRETINTAGDAGQIFVAAAGNDDGQNNDSTPHYPSSYDCQSIIAVLSTDEDDNISSFSNYGPTTVDLGAPGSDILSCNLGGGYRYAGGTSMATPHVAGACALIWSMNPTLTNSEVKNTILQTVDETLTGLCVSDGRLNLYNALMQTTVPWLEVQPEDGNVAPGDTNTVSITFNATDMEPGIYEAEIVIDSNDPYRTPTIIPVTMIVTPDSLVITSDEDFESAGTKGGPFTPQCTTYELTNNGAEPLSWTASDTQDWVQVEPNAGVIDPNQSTDVNVCISFYADSLDPNIYTEVLTFRNEDTNSVKRRLITLMVRPPDAFTESFDTEDGDLEFLSLTFSPDGSTAYYQTCLLEVKDFPTDPNGGTYVPLGDDDFAEIALSDGKEILFYGTTYDRVYVGSNGYITFGQGDTQFASSMENHFNMPRISALFEDLTPADSQSISYKQLDDRMVVTFEDVPLWIDKDAKNSFQIEMFFVDGSVCITWISVEAATPVVGLSHGQGMPVLFTQSDLSEYSPCWSRGDLNQDYIVNFVDFAMFAAYFGHTGCGVPYWCGKSDLDLSGTTDFNDLAIFVEYWLAIEDWWLQPIAHWKFDEAEGIMAYDSVGENHGTIYDANWTTGILDSALNFDGDDDYVDIGNDERLKPPLPITLSAWVNLSSLGSTQYIIALDDQTSEYYGVWFYVNTGNSISVNYGDGGGKTPSDRRSKAGTTALNEDTWYYVAAVMREATDISLYVNGVDDGGAYGGSGEDLAYSDAISLIAIRHDSALDFNGKLDDIRVYDRALSAEEIQQLYFEGLGGKAFDPIPPDLATEIDPNTTLSWSPGSGALSHDVFLGTDYNDVNDADTFDPNIFMGNQDTNTFEPNGLDLGTTYYWRIDEVGSLATRKGDVWSFTTWDEFDPNLNLVSWWKFDEGGGETANDSAGDNHGTVHDTNWATGIIDGALNFDGDGDHVDVGNDSSLKPPLPVTVSAWVRLASTGTSQYIIALDDQVSRYYGIWLYVGSAGNLSINYGDGGSPNSANRRGKSGTTSLAADAWYHVAAVIRGETDMSLYIDGVEDEGTYSGAGGSLDYSTASTFIGMRHDAAFSFDGRIDDMRVYDRVLSDRDVWLLHQDGLD